MVAIVSNCGEIVLLLLYPGKEINTSQNIEVRNLPSLDKVIGILSSFRVLICLVARKVYLFFRLTFPVIEAWLPLRVAPRRRQKTMAFRRFFLKFLFDIAQESGI